jgi:hypothetical protein
VAGGHLSLNAARTSRGDENSVHLLERTICLCLDVGCGCTKVVQWIHL